MRGRLKLETAYENGKTRLKDVFFTAPYKVMSPHIRQGHTEMMVMAASPGLLGDDDLDTAYCFGEDSEITVRTQSYEKIFDTEGKIAQKHTRITAEKGSCVRFLPSPVIPFAGSRFAGDTVIRIHPAATVFYGEILACGRVGMGERFQMARYHSTCTCYVGDILAFFDNTLLAPESLDYTGLGLWQDFTHTGLLYAYLPGAAAQQAFLHHARATGLDGLAGASQCREGVAVRALGHSGEALFQFFHTLCTEIT